MKEKLLVVLEKYEKSVDVQMSSEKILSFLVNDILDYAQISIGKFRKLYNRFNIKDCVEEIILVLSFKAQQLGVTVRFNCFNFQD